MHKPGHFVHKSWVNKTPSTADKFSDEKSETKNRYSYANDKTKTIKVKDREGKRSIDVPKLELFKVSK